MLKPQDILVVLKIAALRDSPWTYKSLSETLSVSAAGVHESVHRSVAAGFLGGEDLHVMRNAVEEFLVHGLRYVIPADRGRLARGVVTATSAPVFATKMVRQEVPLVWAFAHGDTRGESLVPIHGSVPAAARKDPRLHGLLAAADVFRAGGAREREVAVEVLRELLAS